MEHTPGRDAHREELIGQPVMTADGIVLGTIAGIERRHVVIEGRGVSRRVHVLPVAALTRSDRGDVVVALTMDEITQRLF